MTQPATQSMLKTVNFTVGIALLVMLFPIGGKLPDKPAGVRTAIELISKKQSAPPAATVSALALSLPVFSSA